jgi:ABA responsive element binding factor
MISSAATPSSEQQQLARQPSIFTLTFSELQNVLSADPGKSLGSMNVDELMKNIWTAEEGQAMALLMSNLNSNNQQQQQQQQHHSHCNSHAGSDQHASSSTLSMSTVLAKQPSLQRLVSLPPELSRSTVDEVWKDIQRQKAMSETSSRGPQGEDDAFGEMTLEDFLVRAGVGRDELDSSSRVTDGGNSSITSAMYVASPVSGGNAHSDQALTSHPDWMSYTKSQPPQHHHSRHHHHHHHHHHHPHPHPNPPHHHQHHHRHQPQQKLVQKTENLGVHPTPLMLATGSPLYNDRMGDDLPDHSLSSPSLALSPSASDYPLYVNRKRFAPDEVVFEKTVERRQKRMIKNRESAARSRARKQV